MKVKELHKKLDDIIYKGGSEAEVYFDTEAASFDINFVEISSIHYEPNAFSETQIVTMGCPYENYMHIKLIEVQPGFYKKDIKRSNKETDMLYLWDKIKHK